MEEKKYELYVVEVITLNDDSFPIAGVQTYEEAKSIFEKCKIPQYKGCVIIGYINRYKFEIIEEWAKEEV